MHMTSRTTARPTLRRRAALKLLASGAGLTLQAHRRHGAPGADKSGESAVGGEFSSVRCGQEQRLSILSGSHQIVIDRGRRIQSRVRNPVLGGPTGARHDGQHLAGDLAQIGVNATLKSAELASYFAQVQAVSYKGMATGSGVSSQLQPQTLLLGVYHSPVVNLSGYKSDTWANLVDGVSSEVDPAKRTSLCAQINDFLLDEAWNLPVTHSPNRVVTRKNVRGLAFELHEALKFTEVSLA
jgi:ABC-type transport system substrate-binding protein